MSSIIQEILDSGLEGSAILMICAITYKIFRMRIQTESSSDCCKSCFKLHVITSNDGQGSTTDLPI